MSPTEVIDALETMAAGSLTAMPKHNPQSETVAALRDAMLPKFIVAEVRVREATRFVEAAGG